MKRFMAVYIGTPEAVERSGWNKLDEATRQQRQTAGIKAWKDWVAANRGSIVEGGGPLGKTKRTSSRGIEDTRNSMAGYTVVQADSHEAAARLFLNHPHFSAFPGDSVEIMEVLPIPEG